MKWFRMYVSMVDSMKVGQLTDSGFRVYVELLCLAGEKRDAGLTGANARNISWRLRRNVDAAVTECVTAGLIAVTDDGEYRVLDWDAKQGDPLSGSERTRAWRERKRLKVNEVTNAVTNSSQGGDGVDAVEEKRGEEKTSSPNGEEGGSAPPPCPHGRIVDLYHETLPTCPRCLELNDTRQGYIRARWRYVWEQLGQRKKPRATEDILASFRGYFEHVAKSPFLTGRAEASGGRPPFQADLEWLMRPTNWAKVREGKYHRQAQ